MALLTDMFKLVIILNLLSTYYYSLFICGAVLLKNSNNTKINNNKLAAAGRVVSYYPPTCNRIECPSYDVIYSGKGSFEIRRYNSTMWISTQPIDDASIVHAGNTAFYQLFDYIQGDNEDRVKIEMTAPVITEVKPSDAQSFIISFYIPKKNQANPPNSKSLSIQKWSTTYIAVRQFGGFVMDDTVGKEASALHQSLRGTKWYDAIEKGRAKYNGTEYVVAQYNSPFEFRIE